MCGCLSKELTVKPRHMVQVRITKDIFVRDKYNIRRVAFIAGDLVDGYVYTAVLRNNTVVNPEDLPIKPGEKIEIIDEGKDIAEAKFKIFHEKAAEVEQVEEAPVDEVIAPVVLEEVVKPAAKTRKTRGKAKFKKKLTAKL